VRSSRSLSLGLVALVALVALFATGACSSYINQRAADSTYQILVQSQVAVRRLADVELARDALPGGVVQLAAFALAYPDHRGFAELYAESACQYPIAFVFDDWEAASFAGDTTKAARLTDRLRGLLASCVDANLALLAPAWRHARTANSWQDQLASATRDDAGALRWIATADAIAIALAPMAELAKVPATLATLRKVTALAPGAHDADAEILLGTLEAQLGALGGGGDGSARFELARKTLGAGALIADVMYARAVLVAHRDRAGFTAALERVIGAQLATWPERRLANELAVTKAKRYLAAVDTLIAR